LGSSQHSSRPPSWISGVLFLTEGEGGKGEGRTGRQWERGKKNEGGEGEEGGYVLALGGRTPLGLGFLIKAQNFLPLRNQQWRGRDRREGKHWDGRGPQKRSCGGGRSH